MKSELVKKRCEPCEAGTPPLKGTDIAPYISQLNSAWQVVDEHHLQREFEFNDFVQPMKLASNIANLAEAEGHHPDLHISYGKLVVELWTHKIKGLSENDFILAAKIDQL